MWRTLSRSLAALLIATSLNLWTNGPIAHAGDTHRTYTAANGQIYQDGSPIQLRGVSWFGMETATHAPNGLWIRTIDNTVEQMQNAGFNAIRLPVCPATLHDASPTSINYDTNPELLGLSSLQVLDAVVDSANRHGMYILLDHHSIDCATISGLWYTNTYSEAQWITDLQFMAHRYADVPGFVGIDIKNEPHAPATWGSGNAATDWNGAIERAGHAVLTTDPRILVFAQGLEQTTCSAKTFDYFWGENFEPLACTPISAGMVPADKLVLAPHVFGPDLFEHAYFSAKTFPDNLAGIWDAHFGFTRSLGYTIVPSEWGGRYGTDGGDSKDTQVQDALVSYMASHQICSSFYWSWNPDSKDTQGVLEGDWQTIWPSKLQLLQGYWKSCGWNGSN